MPLLEVILLESVKIGIPIVAQKLGKGIYKRLFPPIEKARKSAVSKMADELSSEFPSVNFLELNFKFDSPAMKNELMNILSGEKPNEAILKQEMAREVSQKWPKYSDKAGLIVDSFIKHFEQQCLAFDDLKSSVLAAIIREEHTATKTFIHRESEDIKKFIDSRMSEMERKFESRMHVQNIEQEQETPTVLSALEKKFIQERDEIMALVKRWLSFDLYERIIQLAKEVFTLKDSVNPSISGSIFRLCSSFILRSHLDTEKANKWLNLAEELDPENHKTIALRAEFLCRDKKWSEAKELLEPIAISSNESFLKIVYAECLSHLSGAKEAFEWLKNQDNLKDESDIQLNLAILAVEANELEFALDNTKKLKATPYPGPHPFLLSARILVKQATPRELISVSSPEDLELQKDMDRLRLAVPDLEEGLKLLKKTSKPQKAIAYTAQNLTEIYLQLEDTDSAERHLCENWRFLRNDNKAWFSAASLAFIKNKKEKALYRAQIALDRSKDDDYESFIRFALLCINMGEWDKCLKTIDRIKNENPDKDQLKALLQMELVCYYQSKDMQSTERLIETLKTKFPEDEMWVIHKSIFLTQQGKLDTAIKILTEASNNYPDSIKIKLRLSSLYRQIKNYPAALTIYKKLANLIGSVNSFEKACIVALEADSPDELLTIISTAESVGIISENLNHYRAIALSMSEKYDDAIELFETFPKDSLSSNDYVSFALSYSKRATPHKAIDLLKRAKNSFPKDIRINRSLYFCYLEINKPEDAFEEARICLQRNPDDRAAYFAVISTGFAIGKGEIAHNAMMEYLARFGEGPELKSVQIEDVKKMRKVSSEQSESLWKKYQEGLIPEVLLSHFNVLGTGSQRIMLLNSPAKVMAFGGHPDSQKRQLLDTVGGKQILLDYHALITIYLLNLIEPTVTLFKSINIPQVVLDEISNDKYKLSTVIQKDMQATYESVFSILKDEFEIIDTFPHINLKDITESVGNLIYDLTICKENKCSYVLPGFESKEVSEIRSVVDIEIISIVDIADLMKENGITSITEYNAVIEILSRHKLKKLGMSRHIADRFMFNWQALVMLEECKILKHIPKLFNVRQIGPFSFAVIKSDIDKYKTINDLQNKLIILEENIGQLIKKDQVKIIPSIQQAKNTTVQDSEAESKLEALEDIKTICKENNFILWSDDSCFNSLSAAEGLKTTCTRTVLHVLLDSNLITKENHVQKIIQILKWNMFFCWTNVDLILKCAEMYGYSKNENFNILLGSLINEIKTFSDKILDPIEITNFNVASTCMQRLWFLSDKAQSLAMNVFDEIHAVVKFKALLNAYWIHKVIIDFAKMGVFPLMEFLQKLSLRMTGQIDDTFKKALKFTIGVSLKDKTEGILQVANARLVGANILKAVKVAIPQYEYELMNFALKLDPHIKTLLQ